MCGAGREGQASPAGAGGQEAEYEGGQGPGRRAPRGSQRQVGRTQPQRTDERDVTFIQNVMGSSGLGRDGIKAVFVEDWPA